MVQARIERYAPGFGGTVIASRGISARDYETYDPNYIGGDINGGAVTLKQSVLGPALRVNPYRTPTCAPHPHHQDLACTECPVNWPPVPH
jgi:phytoene dehydrogenase-like protein